MKANFHFFEKSGYMINVNRITSTFAWICLFSCNSKSESKIEIQRDSKINERNGPSSKKIPDLKSELPFGSQYFFDTILFHSNKRKLFTDEDPIYDSVSSFYSAFLENIGQRSISNKDYNAVENDVYAWDFDQSPINSGENMYLAMRSESPFKYVLQFPDRYHYKVYLTSQTNLNRKILNSLSWINLVIENDSSFSSINVYRDLSIDNGAVGGTKLFYIDTSYTIHIKYFTSFGDGASDFFTYIKYRILETGKIVRWYDIDNGDYKTSVEEGVIKNHMRDGIWKEIYGKYPYPNADQLNPMFSYCEYENGMPKGDMLFYSFKNPTKIELRINPLTKQILQDNLKNNE